ncbi:hypothetical protein BDF19DRAFT_456555, partial [Syncephalis fuscata]
GDINISEYIWQAHDNEAILRQRYTNLNFQFVPFIIGAVVFSTNAIKVGIITAKYPYKLAPWCLLSSAYFGVFNFFTYGPSCNALVWTTVISLTISTVLTNLMLLERAYLAYLPALMYMVAAWWCADIRLSNRYGCYMKFAFYLPYFRLLLDLPCNLYALRYSLRLFITRNGIITMVLVILSNIICFFLNLSGILKKAMRFFTRLIGKFITVTLLTESTKNLYFVSQTATAKNVPTKSSLKKKIYSVDSVQETEISMWPTELQSMRR